MQVFRMAILRPNVSDGEISQKNTLIVAPVRYLRSDLGLPDKCRVIGQTAELADLYFVKQFGE